MTVKKSIGGSFNFWDGRCDRCGRKIANMVARKNSFRWEDVVCDDCYDLLLDDDEEWFDYSSRESIVDKTIK